MVLLGESASDSLLNDVLKDVLSTQHDILTTAVERCKGPVYPVFAASMGAAQLDLIRSNFDHNEYNYEHVQYDCYCWNFLLAR